MSNSKDSNPGLRLHHAFLIDQDFDQNQFRNKKERFAGEIRKDHLKSTVASSQYNPIYTKAYQRRLNSLRLDPQTKLFVAEARTRVAPGLGNESPIEVGLAFLQPHGLPFIPASSLKGAMLRHIIKRAGLQDFALLKRGQQEEVEIWTPDASLEKLIDALPDKSKIPQLRMIQDLFGSQASAARFQLIDAWPIPTDPRKPLPLMLDTITNHHPKYYGDKEAKTQPSMTESPNPVSFVSVRPRTQFLFGIRSSSDLAPDLQKLLSETIRVSGIGAKTDKSYGIFGPLEPLK